MSASSQESQDPVPLLGAEEDAAGLGAAGEGAGERNQLLAIETGDGERPLNESHDYSSCSSV